MVMRVVAQEGSPVQPTNCDLLSAAAVMVTSAPLTKEYEQISPQLIPGGLLVTVPLPVPLLVICNRCVPVLVLPGGPKYAVQVLLASIVTTMVAAPLHPVSPVQEIAHPAAGTVSSVTAALAG